MKKVLAAMAAAALVVALAGCTSGASQGSASASASSEAASSETASSVAAQSEAASSAAEPVDGAWQTNGEFDSSGLEEQHIKIFEKANAAMPDADYEPIAIIGEQVVSGLNIAYLAKDKTVSGDEPAILAVVTVYKDTQNNAKVTSVAGIDVANVDVVENAPETGLAGGWEVPDAPYAVTLPADAQAAYDKAMAEYTGVAARPVALLGTQVVAGMNYKFLCIGQPDTPKAANTLYVATVYQDPSGACEVADMQVFDLLSYVGAA